MIKKGCSFLIFFFLFITSCFSQTEPSGFFRVFADNDFLNMFLRGSDHAYSAGSRLDLFHELQKKPKNIFVKCSPSAGRHSVYTTGWSVMQIMITPDKIYLDPPNRNDYPYSGQLFLIHTICSANPEKKINFQTEWVAGIMGPPSLAEQTQKALHQLVDSRRPPKGWEFQLPTDVLLNYNFLAEKQIAAYNKLINVRGGGQVSVGTMKDAVSFYLLYRTGDTSGNYTGYIRQFFSSKKNKVSFFVSLKPAIDFIFYNASLDGGLFNSHSPARDKNSPYGSLLKTLPVVESLEFKIIGGFKKFSLSFTQTFLSREYKGLFRHTYGNISLHFRW